MKIVSDLMFKNNNNWINFTVVILKYNNKKTVKGKNKMTLDNLK